MTISLNFSYILPCISLFVLVYFIILFVSSGFISLHFLVLSLGLILIAVSSDSFFTHYSLCMPPKPVNTGAAAEPDDGSRILLAATATGLAFVGAAASLKKGGLPAAVGAIYQNPEVRGCNRRGYRYD